MEREPSAVARQMARVLRDNYLALIQEGFTPDQAERILVALVPKPPPLKESS